MKKYFWLLFFCLLYNTYCLGEIFPNKTILEGKIHNYDPKVELIVHVERPGFSRISLAPHVDNQGNFYVELEIYGPTDLRIRYKTYFHVLVGARDSIVGVEFDGRFRDTNKLLSSLHFYGSNADTNEYMKQYALLANSSAKNTADDAYARQNYTPETFAKYNASVRASENAIYESFVDTYTPNESAKVWTKLQAEERFLNNLIFYTRDYRDHHNLSMFDSTFRLPVDFYDVLVDRMPMKSEMLKSPYILNIYAHTYKFLINQKLKATRKKSDGWRVDSFGLIGGGDVLDSVVMNSIVTYAKDPILKDVMLTQFFNEKFRKQDIAQYERNVDLVDRHITSSYMKELLQKEYLLAKNRFEKPLLEPTMIMKDSNGLLGKEIFDRVLRANVGKVICIDFWATWCGPCISNFPHMRRFEEMYRDKNASFVYICLGTDYKKFESYIAQHRLHGQHYYLDSKQSKDILRLLDIDKIPHHILVDDDGTIISADGGLSPESLKGEIEKILDGKDRKDLPKY